jgi:hypothetical protein
LMTVGAVQRSGLLFRTFVKKFALFHRLFSRQLSAIRL